MTLSDINKSTLIEDTTGAVQNFSLAMRDVHYSVEQMTEDDVFTNLGITMKNAKNASRSIDIAAEHLVEGRGTIGKLFMDDDTYLRFTSILSKVNTLMNDVNHYGVLFNLNKEWQRTRLKQVTFLNALNTPESFRDYFSKEVDLINTSMSRISMLVSRAEHSFDRDKIFDTNLFKRDFSDLMRLSEELYDNLRLYNEQLQDAQKIAQ